MRRAAGAYQAEIRNLRIYGFRASHRTERLANPDEAQVNLWIPQSRTGEGLG